MSAPGGFVEAQGSVPRAKWTTTQINSAVPSTRGVFTFPAPYNTRAWRITDTTDGAGDIIEAVGYSHWRTMNNHANSSVIKLFVGTKTATGALLFHLNKETETLTKVGPLFPAGSPWRNLSAELWQWTRSRDWMNVRNATHYYRYNVVNNAFELFIDMVGMWGANRDVWQLHSSADDRKHVMSVRNISNPNSPVAIGAGYYNETTGQIRFYSAPNMDEPHIDQSGRWTFIKFNDGSNKIYDNETGDLVWTQAEGLGAVGHSAMGWEYIVGSDNFDPAINATILYTFNPVTHQGVMHANNDWDQGAMQHTSLPNSASKSYQDQLVYGSNADTSPHQNEITVVRMNDGGQQLIVAPVMTNMNAAGGGADPYYKLPKGNVDLTGKYFMWSSNLGGNRLDVFVVHVPTQLLIADPPDSPSVERAGLCQRQLLNTRLVFK
jgi:hypothetical protein